ncbi:hypothetical protein BJV74DRAFT_799106 [Russula compacta]|nr:hypothetical protein BJV74DRAFT_799106 [Russula compacta]
MSPSPVSSSLLLPLISLPLLCVLWSLAAPKDDTATIGGIEILYTFFELPAMLNQALCTYKEFSQHGVLNVCTSSRVINILIILQGALTPSLLFSSSTEIRKTLVLKNRLQTLRPHLLVVF